LNNVLQSLQAWRAISVLAVVVYHLAFETQRVWGDNCSNLFGPLADFGFLGVDVFFAISGFIIVWVYAGKLNTPREIPEYFWHRFTRIYPLYIFISLPSFIAGLISHQLKWKSTLGALALLWPYPLLANPVAWSLCYEISFYIFFASAFLLPRRFLPFILAFWAICIVGHTSEDLPHRLPEEFYPLFSVLNFEILMGAAAALMLKARLIFFPRTCIAFGCLLIAAVIGASQITGHDLANDYLLRAGVLSPAGFLIMYGAVGNEIKNSASYWKWLLTLGAASYSIYLCHYQITVMAGLIVLPYKAQVHPILWELLTGACVTITGVLIYFFVEKPFLKFVRTRKKTVQCDATPQEQFKVHGAVL
jgi:exopolysaccharide production protein ExoZ